MVGILQTRRCVWAWVLLLCLFGEAVSSGETVHAEDSPVEILSHDLTLSLHPDRHLLMATDRLTLRTLTASLQRLSFSLNAKLRIGSVSLRRQGSLPLTMEDGPAGEGLSHGGLREVTVHLPEGLPQGEVLTLEWHYEGIFDDPPRETRQLRFVTPSETSGHIGGEGVYLSGESGWYPDRPKSPARFRATITVPQGWRAVTHGQEVRRADEAQGATSEWEVAAKTEALTVVANRFHVAKREWRDAAGQAIEISTYLFPDEAALAEDYLAASARYLEAYTTLLGPYPFPKFAVVENFFASGLGMPSFTLLGSGVVKRRYVQPYALGHEIVHSWFGNWVFNDVEAGNWVEGLTTYLANYYYDEYAGHADEAREQRRMMALGYAVYVKPEDDYPVGQFKRKVDQKDNAIGYQKSAMVFHMLRREVGDDVFWRGLRSLVAEYGGRYGTWSDIERVFADATGRDLRWFFAQWVEQAGAPSLAMMQALASPAAAPRGGYDVTLRLRQGPGGPPYRLALPVAVTMENGERVTALVSLTVADQTAILAVPSRPVLAAIDPAFETFRRLAREQIPPMLNGFVTDRQRVLVVPSGGTEEEHKPYEELAEHIASREPTILIRSDQKADLPGGSVLVLGGPGVNRAAEAVVQACGAGVRLERDRFTVGGKTYEGPGEALLMSCLRPNRPGEVLTLFYGLTSQALARVARLVFFYGWHSYLVFHDGAMAARGDFPPAFKEEMAVRFAE